MDAVIFDLDDTLIVEEETARASLAEALALDRLGSTAAGTVMVGDSWGRDILGALAVGMRAVWVSKGHRPPADLADVLVVDQLTPEVFDRI